MSRPPARFLSISISLLCLLAGLGLGLICVRLEPGPVESIYPFVDLLSSLWLRALTILALPLIVTQVLKSLTSSGSGAANRRFRIAFGLFFSLHALGAAFAIPLSQILVRLVGVRDGWSPPVAMPAEEQSSLSALVPASFLDWLSVMVPRDVLGALIQGELVLVMFVTVLLGLAVNRAPKRYKQKLAGLLTSLANGVMTLIWWVLTITPFGIFSVAFQLGRQSGFQTAEILLKFVLIVCAVLVAFVAFLYPVACFLGRVRLKDFARAAYPGQVVAVSTRSSLASVPALVRGASQHLPSGAAVSSFIFPLSAAVFRANRLVSGSTKMVFLCYLYEIDVTPLRLLTFLGIMLLLSFSSAGVPGGLGVTRMLPAYLAIGVPVEAVLLAETVDAIPDIFKTLVNVTAYTAVAALLVEWLRLPESAVEAVTEAAGG